VVEVTVVSDDSATMDLGENIPLLANHINIVKFGGKADPKYIAVKGTLSNWLRELAGDLDVPVVHS
jgi:hypothetical protein